MSGTPQDLAAELALTVEEGIALTSLEYRLMQREVAAETSDKKRSTKRAVRDDFRDVALAALGELAQGPEAQQQLPGWASEFLGQFAGTASWVPARTQRGGSSLNLTRPNGCGSGLLQRSPGPCLRTCSPLRKHPTQTAAHSDHALRHDQQCLDVTPTSKVVALLRPTQTSRR